VLKTIQIRNNDNEGGSIIFRHSLHVIQCALNI
jgi:hypothetical protein